MPSHISVAGCIVLGLALAAGHAAADPVQRRIIALSGTDGPLGPGLGPGVVFSPTGLAGPTLDEDGDVAFRGVLSGPGVTSQNNQGIWLDRDETLTLLLRTRDPVPAAAIDAYVSGIHPSKWTLSRDGRLSVIGTVRLPTTGSNLSAAWTEVDNELGLIALQSQAAPGADAGSTFRAFDWITGGLGGAAAFEATLDSPRGVLDGIWTYCDGVLSAVAIEGQEAPVPGMTYLAISSYDYQPAINAAGMLGFLAYLVQPGSPSAAGILVESAGATIPIALEQTVAPDTDGLASFQFLHDPPTLNDAGHVAFRASLQGPGVEDLTRHGIWSDRTGALGLVVRTGDAAPGLGPDGVFTYVEYPGLNDSDEILFYGFDSNQLINGYWRHDGAAITPVVIDETHPAGTPAGIRLDVRLESGMINNAGQSAIFAGFETSDGDSGAYDTGLWIVGRTGSQVLGMRVGQHIEIESGDIRIIARITSLRLHPSPQAGLPRSFNDDGTIVASALFTDGSSAIIAATPVSFCSADTNGDGFVDFADLNEVLGAFNSVVLGPAYDFDADLDLDGAVGFADLNLVLSQLGDDCGG